MEFEPIETQEAFDAAIKERIERAERKAREPFADYDEVRATRDKAVADLEKAAKRADKAEAEAKGLRDQRARDELVAKVSRETGVPASLVRGTTEDEMRDFAKSVAEDAKPKTAPQAPGSGRFDGRGASDEDAAKRELARLMFGGGQ